MTEDELLERYVQSGSEEAFAELVGLHAGWVYASALRQVRERHLAEDVMQAVFIALARKAGTLHGGVKLSTWLFQVTRYAAAKALRAEGRRQEREKKAAVLKPEVSMPDEARWEAIAPLLEPLVSRLRSSDQQAVLLRFYQRKSMAEVGEGLGISEEAAKKRVGRAVEKLREMLAARGVTAESASLGAALMVHVAGGAKAGVAGSAAAAALAGAKAAGGTPVAALAQGAVAMVAVAKVTAAGIAVVAVAAGGAAVVTVLSLPTTRRDAAGTASSWSRLVACCRNGSARRSAGGSCSGCCPRCSWGGSLQGCPTQEMWAMARW